ncbi:MAG TPA: hypothetical protein VKE88_02495, partial [Candidatus Nanoarchaeia archaeon]|nr:hypothetical protein [Candidatus Nanoarchaeia archaeon]
MSATKTLSIFSIILLLILSTLSATALQENFDIQSTNAFAACSYAVTTNTIQVHNTGDVESSYAVSAVGDASSFATYSDSSFSLQPGQSKTIFVYLAPGSRAGSYDLETTVTATFGV